MGLGAISELTDSGKHTALAFLPANPATIVTATVQNGVAFARVAQGGQAFDSVAYHVIANLTTALALVIDKLVLTAVVSESDDNVTFTTAPARFQPPALSVGGVVGSPAVAAGKIDLRLDLNIGGLKKYVRLDVTPVITGTAAGSLQVIGVLGSARKLPIDPVRYVGNDGVIGSNGANYFKPAYIC